MAQDPSADLVLTPLVGPTITVRQALTTFHLLIVALDPFTNESSWVLPTAVRTLKNFEQADCRVSFLLTAEPDDCRTFLGPYATQFRCFTDPDRSVVAGFGLQTLPAILVVGQDGTVRAAAEGWGPTQWQGVTDTMAKLADWLGPRFPDPSDPGPFAGTPALETA